MEEEMEEATEEEMVGVMEEDVDSNCTIFEAVFVATEMDSVESAYSLISDVVIRVQD